MNATALGGQDIVDIAIGTFEGWHPVALASDFGAATWADELVAELKVDSEASDLADGLRGIQAALHELHPDDAIGAQVFLPAPEMGVINALMTYERILLETDDTPESFLAETASHANDRVPGYEVRGYEEWRAPHPVGELVGFTHLAAITQPGEDQATLEQRVVFAIFPPGAGQMVQVVFRSVFLGAFGNMVEETSAIVDTLRIKLEASA
jgi:hypothetical protein